MSVIVVFLVFVLWDNGAVMALILRSLTCEPRQELRHLHVTSDNTTSCCHGLQLPTPL